jgi:hypothetical protein
MKPSLALRIVAGQPRRLVTARPAVIALGLLARTGLVRAQAVWPNAATPILTSGASDLRAARWMNRTFRLRPNRRLPIDAATMNILRAGALVIGGEPPHVAVAVERALGRAVPRQRVAFYATGGTHPKVHSFVFERGASEPLAVVKVMAVREEGGHLEREIANVELARERLGDTEVAAALPVEPLWAGTCAGDFVVAEPVHPFAAATHPVSRDAAMGWLREFADATFAETRPWSEADEAKLAEAVSDAWARTPEARVDALVERVRALVAELRGTPVPRSAVHGDFWAGNLAGAGAALRVYDWEWLEFEGEPFFDVWTFELGELRGAADRGERDLALPLEEALTRVETELERRGLDPRFALPTLPPTLARLTFRVRSEDRYERGKDETSVRVMRAVESLLLDGEG